MSKISSILCLNVVSYARLGLPLSQRAYWPGSVRLIDYGVLITPKKCTLKMDVALGHRPA